MSLHKAKNHLATKVLSCLSFLEPTRKFIDVLIESLPEDLLGVAQLTALIGDYYLDNYNSYQFSRDKMEQLWRDLSQTRNNSKGRCRDLSHLVQYDGNDRKKFLECLDYIKDDVRLLTDIAIQRCHTAKRCTISATADVEARQRMFCCLNGK
jgi:hypothetical protein